MAPCLEWYCSFQSGKCIVVEPSEVINISRFKICYLCIKMIKRVIILR